MIAQFIDLGWQAWLVAATLIGLLGVLLATRLPMDLAFLGAVSLLLIAGVISPREAFGGLANEGVLTVAVLFVVVAGVQDTGGIRWIVHNLLGRPASLLRAQVRLTLPVTVASALINNTPVVAMMTPAVTEWARQLKLPESRLFLPLSYAAILGGTCTLLGTSTNLVVNGLFVDRYDQAFGIFTLAPVGIPVAITGLLTLWLGSRWLLPQRSSAVRELEDVREYTIEMLVEPDGPLVGRSIEAAGLRHLPGCFVIEIGRGDQVLPAVSPQERLLAGDRLVFVGAVDSIVDLRKIRGLVPATDQVFKLEDERSRRELFEAVVGESSPVVGRSIRSGGFRKRYQAVVIAVARSGRRLTGKVGDIILRPGDTLLLEAGRSFSQAQSQSRDFLLTRRIAGSDLPRHERAGIAGIILLGMIAVAGFGLLSILKAAILAAGLMLITRCASLSSARASIDWPLLLTIAAAFGLGEALANTGLASAAAGELAAVAGDNPLAGLLVVYATTAGLSAVMTNNAAAVLMFPLAMAFAGQGGLEPASLALAVMFGASASFATPMSYQTNLMVMGAGGYRFVDYLRAGLPLTIVTGAVAVPGIWYWGKYLGLASGLWPVVFGEQGVALLRVNIYLSHIVAVMFEHPLVHDLAPDRWENRQKIHAGVTGR